MNSFLLNKWKFHYNDLNDGWYKGYCDDEWEDVYVPHDWSVHMPFSKSNGSGTGYLSGGIAWYRTQFFLPKALKGKRIYIVFDGVYKNSQVWCNSYYLGKRPFGYATFMYDITDQACFGDEPNQISVKVSHNDIFDSRWFTGSGIYRKVQIIVMEPIHTTYQGLFFTTPELSKDEAKIQIENPIINTTNKEATVTVTSQLVYEEKLVASFSNQTILSPNEEQTIITNGLIKNPMLWSTSHPYLYDLVTIIESTARDGSFSYKEEQHNTVGIRSIRFSPRDGFFLNDENMKIKGVCLHHDAGSLGAAVLPEVWLRRLIKLKEMGCNGIRMSHNPHMPELYDLCDRLGFLVMDEAFDEWEGPKNKWTTGHNVYPPIHQGYYEDFIEWHEKDLMDLVKRDRNHPSVIMWSIGNEIDYPNDPYCHPLFTSMTGNNDKNKPEAERQFNSNKPNAERLSLLCKRLTNIVKKVDTTRPVTTAVAFPELSTKIGFIDPLDVVGYNYKEQYYEDDHKNFPDKPFLGSENSHSYMAWKYVRDLDYISGQFLWTGIDYLGEAHGWPIHGSYAGILTLAGFEKTSYYRRKSFWVEEAFVYLVTARADKKESLHKEWKHMYRSFNYIKGEEIEVRCYTNMPYATLFINDSAYEGKAYDDSLGYISWIIPYEEGNLKVIAADSLVNGKQSVEDSISPTGSSCNINLKVWDYIDLMNDNGIIKQNINSIAKTLHTLTQVEVSITDANMNLVSNDSSILMVEITGGGTLVSLENGDLADVTDYTANYRRALEGKLIIYIRRNSENDEPVKVKVSGHGLRSASITI